MYENLFDNKRQWEMRKYFIELADRIGIKKVYKKNEIVKCETENYVGIVTKGILYQNVISSKGQVHSLYLLRKGEIFGETFYFCGGENNILAMAKEEAEVSFLLRERLEAELSKNPEGYRYFIHSITRKYRIVMLQLTNNIFNDSIGKIADALLRLSSCTEADPSGRDIVSIPFTHQELANNIGCSRITVTNCLNRFLDEKIISYDNKKIVINDMKALKKYIDAIYD